MRVAVVGAGAAGLSVLRLIPEDILKNGEVVCFESSNYYGGQWCQYEPKNAADTKEDPTSSMYKNLVTNLPTCIMQYPDYKWENAQSFVHHTQVAKYLMDYCYAYDLQNYVKLNRKVTNVTRNSEDETWNVSSIDYSKQQIEYRDEVYDYVFVCSGHFTYPRSMEFPGLENFPGQVIHSRWFDDPADYTGKTVMVVGKGLSGIDICCELVPYCKKVLVTSHTKTDYFQRYPSVSEVPIVNKYEDGAFVLNNGTAITEHIDAVILCTGFTYDMPFLDRESSQIEIGEGYLGPLYKFTVHSKIPSLFFIGLNQRICPFTLFYYQSAFCWAIVTKQLKLPLNLEKVAEKEIEERTTQMRRKHFFHLSFDEETDIVNFFAEQASLPPPPKWLARVREGVAEQRKIDPIQYKKQQITIVDDREIVIADPQGNVVSKLY